MKRYIALIKGYHDMEVCDYAIACNEKYIVREANSAEEVYEYIKKEYGWSDKDVYPNLRDESNRRTQGVVIYETTGTPLIEDPEGDFLSKCKELYNEKKKREDEAREYAEYERLKRKFENK